MLGNKKGKMICGYVPDYVLFDLETTGTSCIYDEVIEISAVKVRSGKVVEEFSRLVNPKRPIPYAASMVNHRMRWWQMSRILGRCCLSF